MSHSDHRATGVAVFDAVYPAARNRNFFPELLEEGLMPHSVDRIYFFGTERPNTWVDIAETVELKIEALRCHRSQVERIPASQLEEWLRQRCTVMAEGQDFELAESFHRAEAWY